MRNWLAMLVSDKAYLEVINYPLICLLKTFLPFLHFLFFFLLPPQTLITDEPPTFDKCVMVSLSEWLFSQWFSPAMMQELENINSSPAYHSPLFVSFPLSLRLFFLFIIQSSLPLLLKFSHHAIIYSFTLSTILKR